MKNLLAAAAILLGLATATACEPVAEDPAPVQGADAGGKTSGSPSKKAKPPIGLKAKRVTAERSVLSDGGALSCVKVTVTNQRRKVVNVNPLYFAITDTSGTKHDASEALADYEGQIATTDLAPGEKATGVVCGKGKFTPKTISMTDELLSTTARATVS